MVLLAAISCRKEEEIIGSTTTKVIYPDPEVGEVKGFFLLNEGNMGNNKATLDYFDYESGDYSKNIFAERNPMVEYELGDVGNDIQIYNDRIYAVINCSNLVEVMSTSKAEHVGSFSIPNCRYIVFKGDYAYVSSYAGPVQIDPNARLGYVAKVDLNTLKVVDECAVGYQPDGLAVVGDKLYVANSGGYRKPNYDSRLSVIDLNTFEETKKIEVAPNLNQLLLDPYGFLWISSRGDYGATPSRTYILDTQTDEIVKMINLPNNKMTRSGDTIYVLSTEWSDATSISRVNYAKVDIITQQVVSPNIMTDGTASNIKIPYGIAVNPATKEIFITDAKDYITPGAIHCYTPDGVLKWSTETGDTPAHIAFTTEKLQPIK